MRLDLVFEFLLLKEERLRFEEFFGRVTKAVGLPPAPTPLRNYLEELKGEFRAMCRTVPLTDKERRRVCEALDESLDKYPFLWLELVSKI